MSRRLPTLGPRGEGWVVIQFVLLPMVVAAGWFGPAWDGPVRAATSVIGAGLLLGGAAIAGRGLLDLRHVLTPLPHPRADGELIEDGAYRLVRHPIYGGLVLGGAGWGLLTASPAALAGAAALLVFFDLKARVEEHWCDAHYPDYAAYRARTRKLIPFVY
jgi:protein-S-isoprenylcysteine O-methyltransferase Ste14